MEKWIEEAVRAVSTDRAWLLILAVASGLIYLAHIPCALGPGIAGVYLMGRFYHLYNHVDELTAALLFAHGLGFILGVR